MKVENYTEIIIHLFLSEWEAQWLRTYVQNYNGNGEELPGDYEIRKAFFDTLTSILPNILFDKNGGVI
ncbi:MAG: hypothetical protein IMZ43_09570 [Thermoplasmata archaeon]|nr:hypothetical protein [Thermoplasmata archaeon]